MIQALGDCRNPPSTLKWVAQSEYLYSSNHLSAEGVPMPSSRAITVSLLAVIAVCLLKLAFLGSPGSSAGIIPQAYAGGVIEWKDALRIVTASDDGATTYVWDYDAKTKVRKYTAARGKLTMEIFELEK
jgi:hypothetical protein